MKVNGWLKKHSANIITILIIAITVISTAAATTATVKSDISHLEEDVTACEVTNAIQNECITLIRIDLGIINGKLDTLLKQGGE